MESPENVQPNKDVQIAEERDALRSAIPQLVQSIDKCRFTVNTINVRSKFLSNFESAQLETINARLIEVLQSLTQLNCNLYE